MLAPLIEHRPSAQIARTSGIDRGRKITAAEDINVLQLARLLRAVGYRLTLEPLPEEQRDGLPVWAADQERERAAAVQQLLGEIDGLHAVLRRLRDDTAKTVAVRIATTVERATGERVKAAVLESLVDALTQVLGLPAAVRRTPPS